MNTSSMASSIERTRAALLRDIARGRTRPHRPIQVAERSPPQPVAGDPKLERVSVTIVSEPGAPQGRVPCVIVRPVEGAPGAPPPPPPPRRRRPARAGRPPSADAASAAGDAGPSGRPAVVVVHSSFNSKEGVAHILESYARRGYVAAALDCRYHGERAGSNNSSSGGGGGASSSGGNGGGGGGGTLAAGAADRGAAYQDAVISAWRGETGERPFLLDNAWDAMTLLGLLEETPGVDGGRLGMTGISLGGMITW